MGPQLNDLSPKERQALRFIRNEVVHRGRMPSTRELQRALGYASPRSAALILERFAGLGIIRKRPGVGYVLARDPEGSKTHAKTVDVSIVGSAPCGPALLAEENFEGVMAVSTELARPPHRYFLLRARGDSMNRAGIQDGDLVLVRQQATAANGEAVVALIDGEVTIKRMQRTRNSIRLEPVSKNKKHQPIIMHKDFDVQGIVMGVV